MIVRFWGVRGSIASPGPGTLRYGGNTSCVSIDTGEHLLILDAGTGMRALGESLARSTRDLCVLLSHPHADHIAGFPFFAPIYEPDRCVDIIDFELDDVCWSLSQIFDGLHSPVLPAHAARLCRHPGGPDSAVLRERGFDVRGIPLNHPGGAWGFRITEAGRSFVYMTDNEIDGPHARTSFDAFAEFCRGATVLCHDAQFLDEEIAAHRGWGHSALGRVCDLAIAAEVEQLVLFHHDPARSDAAVDRIVETAGQRIRSYGIGCEGAWEGMEVRI